MLLQAVRASPARRLPGHFLAGGGSIEIATASVYLAWTWSPTAHRTFKHPPPRPHRGQYRAAADVRHLDFGERPAALSRAARSGSAPGVSDSGFALTR